MKIHCFKSIEEVVINKNVPNEFIGWDEHSQSSERQMESQR